MHVDTVREFDILNAIFLVWRVVRRVCCLIVLWWGTTHKVCRVTVIITTL